MILLLSAVAYPILNAVADQLTLRYGRSVYLVPVRANRTREATSPSSTSFSPTGCGSR
jgi:hypothetical protein